MLSMSLVTRLRRSPREPLVDVTQRQDVDLVLHRPPQALHQTLDHAGQGVGGQQPEHGRPQIEDQGLDEDVMQLPEVDMSPLDALDDQVGGVAEDSGPEHVHGHPGDREHRNHGQLAAFHPKQPGQSANDGPEVLGALGWDAYGVEPAGRPGLVRVDVGGRLLVFVDRRHAGSRSPSWDCTISA